MKFTKMHGLGNDFIIIENLDTSLKDVEKLGIKLCQRHTGLGADGILLVEESKIAHIKMRIINSDGSEANMCGNGIRCFAKYVYEKGIVNKEKINIETRAGIMVVEVLVDDNKVMLTKVNMGIPSFDKNIIPFKGEENNMNYKINIGNKSYIASTILMGVPHTIIYVNQIEDDEIIKFGKKIEKLAYFPIGTNVNFVKVIDENTIKLKTWERGAGLTLACGTGTCASVVVTHLNNLTKNKVCAKLELGDLNIYYDGKFVFMEGEAEYICKGETLINMQG